MKLTEAQIKNWRTLLSFELGPYAYLMPEDEIERRAQHLQDAINAKKATRKDNKNETRRITLP